MFTVKSGSHIDRLIRGDLVGRFTDCLATTLRVFRVEHPSRMLQRLDDHELATISGLGLERMQSAMETWALRVGNADCEALRVNRGDGESSVVQRDLQDLTGLRVHRDHKLRLNILQHPQDRASPFPHEANGNILGLGISDPIHVGSTDQLASGRVGSTEEGLDQRLEANPEPATPAQGLVIYVIPQGYIAEGLQRWPVKWLRATRTGTDEDHKGTGRPFAGLIPADLRIRFTTHPLNTTTDTLRVQHLAGLQLSEKLVDLLVDTTVIRFFARRLIIVLVFLASLAV